MESESLFWNTEGAENVSGGIGRHVCEGNHRGTLWRSVNVSVTIYSYKLMGLSPCTD